MRAAMTTDAVPGQISVLYQRIHPAIEQSGGNIDKAIQANARIQAELLRILYVATSWAMTADFSRCCFIERTAVSWAFTQLVLARQS
jgi:hypothetical protein